MREEVRRLWIQALEDLETARILIDARRYYASVFFSHQAAEKALKALYMHRERREPPKTHNLVELLEELDVRDETLLDPAMELSSEYTVSRYPNAAGGIPAKMYNERIAEERYRQARIIVEYCRRELGV